MGSHPASYQIFANPVKTKHGMGHIHQLTKSPNIGKYSMFFEEAVIPIEKRVLDSASHLLKRTIPVT